MITRPIDTVKYIGHAITDSFNRDVIHGDAESRGKWFTYAVVSVLGFKGVSKVGKIGAQAAKKGAQKTVQRLDELLPYHPKHQLAIDGPVPYNVYDGVQFKKQIIIMAKKINDSGVSKKTSNVIVEISHPVINGNRTGSALKTDYFHAFNDIIDNHARYAKTFTIEGGDKIKRELYQITGSNNGKNGVFEWIVEPNGDISHRRFIESGVVTGIPNQIIKGR